MISINEVKMIIMKVFHGLVVIKAGSNNDMEGTKHVTFGKQDFLKIFMAALKSKNDHCAKVFAKTHSKSFQGQ
jgi:hypothetical protein